MNITEDMMSGIEGKCCIGPEVSPGMINTVVSVPLILWHNK